MHCLVYTVYLLQGPEGEGHYEGLPPEQGQEDRQQPAEDTVQGGVVPVLQHHQPVPLDVFHVDSGGGLDGAGAEGLQKPGAVGVEEGADDRGVRVVTGVRLLVVGPVEQHEGVDRELVEGPCDHVAQEEEELEGRRGGVGAVGPQPVGAGCLADPQHLPEEQEEQGGLAG